MVFFSYRCYSSLTPTTQQPDYQAARNYWKVLKNRLKKDGSESVTNCNRLKLEADDGKKYLTDVADIQTLLRIIQSVPSPKAEPIKLWLAKVGYERIQESVDPELSVNRARENWQLHGRSEKWIQQRMMGQETRNKLTDYWQDHGISKGQEFAILTNIIHKEWSELTVQQHKNFKGLETQNLRDHMDDFELIFNMLGERATTEIHRTEDSKGLPKLKSDANRGGNIAGGARKRLERELGRSVVSKRNFLQAKEKRIGGK